MNNLDFSEAFIQFDKLLFYIKVWGGIGIFGMVASYIAKLETKPKSRPKVIK